MSSTVNSLPSLRTLQTLGLTTSSFLSSFAFTASYLAIPSVALAPVSLQVRQWAVIYNYGKLVSPPLATLSALIWSTAAYRASREGKDPNT
ncbi:hypothetical protein B0O99DRAFT_629086 [Bisporella sp. PMI_857]|jgi:hypothetical protein|nr:hypothetical protein B0O99DRAFT_629086 [Bisporella sp. PMI_857]